MKILITAIFPQKSNCYAKDTYDNRKTGFRNQKISTICLLDRCTAPFLGSNLSANNRCAKKIWLRKK